jgi:hypothetical protein
MTKTELYKARLLENVNERIPPWNAFEDFEEARLWLKTEKPWYARDPLGHPIERQRKKYLAIDYSDPNPTSFREPWTMRGGIFEIMSRDLGDNPADWQEAREMLYQIEEMEADAGGNVDTPTEEQEENHLAVAMPSFIIDLIEQGYVDRDGKTAMTGLDNIAEFLSTRIENLTADLLLKYFVQKDGTKYSQRSAQDAVKRNRTQ